MERTTFYQLMLLCLFIGCLKMANSRKMPYFSIKQESQLCMKASQKSLETKLKSLGGYNKQITATDTKSAKENWEKMVSILEPKKHSFKFSKTLPFLGRKSFSNACEQSLKSIMDGKSSMKRYPMRSGQERITSFPVRRRPERVLSWKDDLIRELLEKRSFQSRSCIERGSVTQNGNLNLCKACTVSTTLPPDRYPRYITEVICGGDNTCLRENGACVEKPIQMTFLKRSQECVKNGDGIYMEDWQPYQQMVRVGCECEMKQASALAWLV